MKIFRRTFFAAAFAILLMSSSAYAADITLPSPERNGGPGVLSAIEERGSAKASSFAKYELSTKELSTLLWAATGKNRGGTGWTVPFAMGTSPYVFVYVLLENGSYIYDPDKNMLKMLGDRNMISRAGRQEFIATAPAVFVLATRGGGPRIDRWAEIAAGAMSQNVYLAAQAFGLKTRFVQSFNRDTLANTLQMGPLERILCIMPVGRQ